LTGSRQSLQAVPPESFGSLLRNKRLADDLTQAELGERFRVRQQTIGAWERGERPQSRFLNELATYLEFNDERDLAKLLDGQAGPSPVPEVPGAGSDQVPETDGAAMRMIAWSFVQDRQSGSLPPAQADVYRSLIQYFQARADS
jgi:transcriptional regulator with XRE-family HTH domain